MNRTEKKKPQIIEVSVERIVPNGYGIAFAENLTVFVALAAPGDRLRVRLDQVKGRTAFAEIVEIIESSPQRVGPRCAYFGRCGGCDFQHLGYEHQLAAKIGIVRDCLKRIGKIEFGDIPIVPSPNEFGYRSRARWHADTRRGEVGYFKRGSNSIVEVESCPILVPELESCLGEIRRDADWNSFWAQNVELDAAASSGAVSVFSEELIEPTRELDFHNGADRYTYDARSFFQGNQSLIGPMVDLATDGAGGDVALDLYCGVGLFTLPLARRFRRVVGVESGQRAVDSAKKNLAAANLANAEVFADGVANWLAAHEREFANADLVLLDPPRSGTERGVVESLGRMRPRSIVYVACEPSTLARDLRSLVDAGYSVDTITALDLFPQTHHVETIVKLNLA